MRKCVRRRFLAVLLRLVITLSNGRSFTAHGRPLHNRVPGRRRCTLLYATRAGRSPSPRRFAPRRAHDRRRGVVGTAAHIRRAQPRLRRSVRCPPCLVAMDTICCIVTTWCAFDNAPCREIAAAEVLNVVRTCESGGAVLQLMTTITDLLADPGIMRFLSISTSPSFAHR